MTEFDQVYQKYFRDVYKYLLVLCRNQWVAEEITQETFFKVLEKLDQFDGRSSLYSWLCQIAKHTYFDHCRREKRKGREEEPPGPRTAWRSGCWIRSPSRRSTRGSTRWRNPIRRFFSSASLENSLLRKLLPFSTRRKAGPV